MVSSRSINLALYLPKLGCSLAGWLRLPCLFVLLLFSGCVVYAQPSPPPTLVPVLPESGFLLRQGWRFLPADHPAGASPSLDDSRWSPIDPTLDLRDLPQLRRPGISWIRLRFVPAQKLDPVMVHIFQSVASEVYLDGRLLFRFGKLSADPKEVAAYNPTGAFSLPALSASEHVLAVRLVSQPGLDYWREHDRWDAAAFQFELFPPASITAIRPIVIKSTYLDTFKVGIAFILFILHLGLYLAYRVQRANLYVAGLYLLLGLTYLSKAVKGFTHTVSLRMLFHYGTMLDAWVPAIVVLTFYTLFGYRKSGLFWLAIGAIVLRCGLLATGQNGPAMLLTFYLQFEFVRLAWIATQKQLVGARIILVGVVFNLFLWVAFVTLDALGISIYKVEWLFHTLFVAAFLCNPLTLSLRLALEHGWINRQLVARLQEVEHLSERNLAQQREKQELLARQNEQLEQQVNERTGELRQQAHQLKELNQTRTRFVTNLTHEFRTPLSLIITPVEKLLESAELPDRVRHSLKTVDRNARHLLNQVNQLLDIARFEGGHVSLVMKPVGLSVLTTQLVGLFEENAQEKAIELSVAVSADRRDYLMDADKWGKIVYNLLANALKFTPSGGAVNVLLHIEKGKACLTVTDTGIGIAPEKQPYIFQQFYQVDDELNRSFEGTGVGLALVRELTDLMGGTISVTSWPGNGSTFTVCLPVSLAPQKTDMSSVTLLQPSQQPGPLTLGDSKAEPVGGEQAGEAFVLLIEDNADMRSFMAEELAGRYRVMTAENGLIGWQMVQKHLPDVVISDVMMPQMDGFGLTNLIKTTPATDHIAVMLLTARSTYESRIEGLQHGADDYLVKPVDLTELRLRLANLVAHQQRLQRYNRQQLIQPLAEDPNPVTEPVTDPFLERIYALLEANLDNPEVSVEWLASEVAMDRRTLHRKIKSKIELKPVELIRSYKLSRAASFLRAGKTIAETADLIGFESVSYFGECFKKEYQITPTDFINQVA